MADHACHKVPCTGNYIYRYTEMGRRFGQSTKWFSCSRCGDTIGVQA
jgi:hypothetical protein